MQINGQNIHASVSQSPEAGRETLLKGPSRALVMVALSASQDNERLKDALHMESIRTRLYQMLSILQGGGLLATLILHWMG